MLRNISRLASLNRKQVQAVQDCVLKLVECQATMAVTTKAVYRTGAIAAYSLKQLPFWPMTICFNA